MGKKRSFNTSLHVLQSALTSLTIVSLSRLKTMMENILFLFILRRYQKARVIRCLIYISENRLVIITILTTEFVLLGFFTHTLGLQLIIGNASFTTFGCPLQAICPRRACAPNYEIIFVLSEPLVVILKMG